MFGSTAKMKESRSEAGAIADFVPYICAGWRLEEAHADNESIYIPSRAGLHHRGWLALWTCWLPTLAAILADDQPGIRRGIDDVGKFRRGGEINDVRWGADDRPRSTAVCADLNGRGMREVAEDEFGIGATDRHCMEVHRTINAGGALFPCLPTIS